MKSKLAEVSNLHAPDKGLTEFVEEILLGVKSGEIKAVGVVMVKLNGTVANGWRAADGFGAYHYLNSGAAMLSSRLAADRDA